MTDRDLLAAENAVLRRQLAERSRSLAEAEARYDAVFNASLSMMSICTPDGVVLDVNRATLQAARLKIEDVVGRHIWETPWFARHPTEAEKVAAAIRKQPGQFVEYESRLLSRLNDWRVLHFLVRPFRSHVGGVVRFLVIEGRDVTARAGSPAPAPAQ